jgi:hypothetical protein
MNKTAEQHLNDLTESSPLNFSGLLYYLASKDIKLESYIFPYNYHFAVAMATEQAIFLNDERVSEFSDDSLFHILLHEVGHYLRTRKIGVGEMDEEVSRIETGASFLNHVINEEKIAERFASIMFYRLNKLKDNSQARINFSSYRFTNMMEDYTNRMFKELKASGLKYSEFFNNSLNIKK